MLSVSLTCSSTSRSTRFEIHFLLHLRSTVQVFITFIGGLFLYLPDLKALQKDVLINGSALNDIITGTKKFLEENRSKLMPDQIAIIESKLEDAKSKAQLINQRAEESRKDLEKVVTTAIKQENEKVRVQITSMPFVLSVKTT